MSANWESLAEAISRESDSGATNDVFDNIELNSSNTEQDIVETMGQGITRQGGNY